MQVCSKYVCVFTFESLGVLRKWKKIQLQVMLFERTKFMTSDIILKGWFQESRAISANTVQGRSSTAVSVYTAFHIYRQLHTVTAVLSLRTQSRNKPKVTDYCTIPFNGWECIINCLNSTVAMCATCCNI